MAPKKISKKSKKKKDTPFQEFSSYKITPEKKVPQDFQVLLKDLSPFNPNYGTCFESNLFASNPKDLIMIQTPNDKHHKPLLFEQVEIELPKISDIIIWENKNSSDEPSSYYYSSETEKQNLKEESMKIELEENILEEQNKDIIKGKYFEAAVQRVQEKEIVKKNIQNKKKQESKQKRKIFCNCKKTKCLKLYCDCFRENLTCEGCNCIGCHNLQANEEERNNAMLSLMDRNPDAFKPKIELSQHSKGCNCKKSNCLKKYCECFQAGLKCGQNCKCQECKNQGQGKVLDHGEKEVNNVGTAKKEKKFEEWRIEN